MPGQLRILEGATFCICDEVGDLHHQGEGLFSEDTRYLSRFKLTINGHRPLLLSSDKIEYFSAAFFMRNPLSGGLDYDALSIRRERFVGDGMQDSFAVQNQSMQPVEFDFELDKKQLAKDMVLKLMNTGKMEHEFMVFKKIMPANFEHFIARGAWFLKPGQATDLGPCVVAHADAVERGPDRAAIIAARLAERTEPRQRIRNIDDIPRPAWHLFPVASYLEAGFTYGVNLGRSMPILATRGCPYQCTFCSSPAMWTTRYYVRDVADVVDEIADYVECYRATNIDFYDLTAIIKRDWILQFCAELERRKLAITYQLPTGTRSEALDDEVLAALYRTGCRNICYAPESGSAQTLARIKKKIKPERMVRSMREATRAGIVVKANLMIGFPDETREELWQTVRFGMKLAWLGVEDLPLFPFIPYPGTALYDSLRAKGVVPEMSNEYFAQLGYGDLDSARSLSPHISSRQLAMVRLVGMLVFLLIGYARRPWRVIRTLRALITERSTTVVELRLVDIKRRMLAVVRRGVRRAVGGLNATPVPKGKRNDRVIDFPEPLAAPPASTASIRRVV